jgi:putative DNA primase/helicase
MDDGADRVRRIMSQGVPVDLPDGLARADGADHAAGGAEDGGVGPGGAPDWDGMDPGAPPAEGEDPPEKRCAAEPLNDVGNGRRFVIWFGEDLAYVGRIGWHIWDGRRWALDSEISKGVSPRTRALAQQLGPLIEREVRWLEPTDAQSDLLQRLGRARSDLKFLANLPESERGEDWEAQCRTLSVRVADCEKRLQSWFKSIERRQTHAKNAGNSQTMSNFVSEASVILRKDVADMDADAFAVNCLTGTLRLRVDPGGDGSSRTAWIEVKPHDRADLMTKIMPVDYDPKALSPKFDAFLARIQPERDMRDFLQRWFGYSMFGSTSEQSMCYFYGLGANGKSVISELMARMIGDYAASARIQSLTGGERRGGGDATPDLMGLIGARMVRASEPEDGVQWNEAFIKEITGGEPMKVRALHSDFVDFKPEMKVTLSGNHEPDIRGTDDGIWRRLMIVPFKEQIPKAERRDMNELIADLMTESSGILNWLIDGAIDWAEGGLQAPEIVRVATQALRDESDPIGEFLRDVCLATGDPDDWMTRAGLSEAFNFWRDSQGLSRWSGNTITRKMKPRIDTWRHPETGSSFTSGKRTGEHGFKGLRLRDFFRKRLDLAPRDQKGKLMFKPGSEVSDEDA